MSLILQFLYVGGAVLLLFGAAVFFHEWGHFYVARRRGMKVEAFAIGFGPKLFSWTRDGIEYSWRLIPAGGFVKLPQMLTSEALEGKAAVDAPPPASPLDKILVAVAGPVMNIVFAFVIASVIYVVGLPVLVNPSSIGYVDPTSAEAKMGIAEGDRIVMVDGRATKTWQDVQMATVIARTNMVPVVLERNGQRQSYVLEAKQSVVVGGKFLNLDPKDHPTVMDVTKGSAAEEAGILAKDTVISFSGMPISSTEQLIKLIQKAGGLPSPIVVQRGKEKLSLSITPKVDPGTQVGRIGVALGSNSVNVYEVQKPGPLPWDQLNDIWKKTISTFSALIHPKETGVGAKDLTGPIGIFAMLATWVHTDYRLALSFLVLLNVNLAVLNMLPLPVLDGGHIMLSILEAVRRKPLNVRIQEYATTIFAVMLISFMAYVSFHDIKRFPLFKAMFKQDSQIEAAPSAEPASVPVLQNAPTNSR